MFEALDGGRIQVNGGPTGLTVPVWQEQGRGIDFAVTIPNGYISDGYSIPRFLWSIVGHPLGQSHLIPALVHDYLCDEADHYEQRVIADCAFFSLLSQYGVPRWKRTVFYLGVRAKGAWSLRGLKSLVIGCLVLAAMLGARAIAAIPETGWITEATVDRVVDGDTLDVVVSRVVRVRLRDCWAPERYTADGPAATANLKRLCPERSRVVLRVPTHSGDLQDVFTFGRTIGDIWATSDPDHTVSERQVEAGFATKEKRQ